jgi:hypothetical protein
LAASESRVGARTSVLVIVAAVIAIIVQSSLRRELATKEERGYQFASAVVGGTVVAVRFAAQANAAEVMDFLDAYHASLVGGPRPDGLYRLRIDGAGMSDNELTILVRRMAQEKVVDFAAPAQ